MSAEAQRDALTLFPTSKPNGTGFGLPLAVKIVESEHGGRLSIESVKGRGTIGSYHYSKTPTRGSRMNKRHIALIVEDDKETAEDLARSCNRSTATVSLWIIAKMH